MSSPTINGAPCRVCGATERYLSTGKCVACARKNGIKRYRLNKDAPEYAHVNRFPWDNDDLAKIYGAVDPRFGHMSIMPWSGNDDGFISEIPLARLMAGRA